MRAGLAMRIKQENLKEAAISASNLGELELTLGEVSGAVGDAEQSVTYADRSGDTFLRIGRLPRLADSLHQAGRLDDAKARFVEAESMLAEFQPDYPLLYSLWGFLYCDLLLANPERAAWRSMLNLKLATQNPKLVETCCKVADRAEKTRGWEGAAFNDGLLEIALDHLTLGRAALYAASLERSAAFTPLQRPNESIAPNDDERRSDLKVALQSARRELDAAVDGLRRAGKMDDLPRGFLSRAWLRFLTGVRTGSASAQEDLDEAWEIAERGPMRLFLADIHLYRARLFIGEATYPWESPTADLAAARKLIEQCGYGRRKEELEDAEAGLRQQHS
jgi:hypothetical protein